MAQAIRIGPCVTCAGEARRVRVARPVMRAHPVLQLMQLLVILFCVFLLGDTFVGLIISRSLTDEATLLRHVSWITLVNVCQCMFLRNANFLTLVLRTASR